MCFCNCGKWLDWCTIHPKIALMSSTVSTVGLSLVGTLGTYRWTFHVERNHDRHMSKRLPVFQLSHIVPQYILYITSNSVELMDS